MQPLTCSSARDAFVSCRHSTSQPKRRMKHSTPPNAPAVVTSVRHRLRARAGRSRNLECNALSQATTPRSSSQSACVKWIRPAASSAVLAPTRPLCPIAAAAAASCLSAAFQTTGRCGCGAGRLGVAAQVKRRHGAHRCIDDDTHDEKTNYCVSITIHIKRRQGVSITTRILHHHRHGPMTYVGVPPVSLLLLTRRRRGRGRGRGRGRQRCLCNSTAAQMY